MRATNMAAAIEKRAMLRILVATCLLGIVYSNDSTGRGSSMSRRRSLLQDSSPTPNPTFDPETSLVEFYDSTNGDGWNFNTLWKSPGDKNLWFGLEYDNDADKVLGLELEDNNLIGE
jgi:hypothetical protein